MRFRRHKATLISFTAQAQWVGWWVSTDPLSSFRTLAPAVPVEVRWRFAARLVGLLRAAQLPQLLELQALLDFSNVFRRQLSDS